LLLTYGGGGGGCQPVCIGCEGGCHDCCIGAGGLYGAGWVEPVCRLIVGCSLGLTLGGIGGDIIVGGGSARNADVSMSEVPSFVQKLNHSWSNT